MNCTIAIPCYSQAEFLPQAIESALNQTVKCDIIVVDDGSPDETRKVALQYPVDVISQVNKGLASARNTALMNTQTEYFLPLDADDYLEPTAVETLLRKAEESSAKVVAPSMRTFGLHAETVVLMPEPKIADFRIANRIPYCALIETQTLKRLGGYSPRMAKGYEDYHLWFNFLTRGYAIETLPQVLFNYRTKKESMIHEAVRHHDELMKQIYRDFPEILPGEIHTVAV